jgi:hypothetical protein
LTRASPPTTAMATDSHSGRVPINSRPVW